MHCVKTTSSKAKGKEMKKAEKAAIGVTAALLLIAGTLGANALLRTVPPPAAAPAPVASEPPAPAPAPAPVVSKEDVFDQVVGTSLGYGAVDAARDVAEAFCDSLRNGTDFGTASMLMLAIGQQEGVTPSQLGTIVGAGVPAFCPEYSDDMQRWSESQ